MEPNQVLTVNIYPKITFHRAMKGYTFAYIDAKQLPKPQTMKLVNYAFPNTYA